MNALDGIRILDLSRVLAGPWCTQTLADLGADVVKVERPPGDNHPGGDDTRGWGPPFLRGRDGADTAEAAYYLGANRNKRSITCDIATPAGQALIRELAAKADVFVENYKVGDMARYGLDFESLRALNPRLVYCSITGFGQTGPYKERAGYDFAIQAMGGLMSVTGERDDLPGGGPQKVGVAVADLFTGLYATVAIQAALRHAERTGEGQHIDMALLDTQVAMLANLGANYLVRGREDGKVPGRAGNAHANIVPYQVFEVAPDAQGQAQHIILAVGNDGQFAKFCAVAGQPELATDARFAQNQNRVRHRAVLVPLAGNHPEVPQQGRLARRAGSGQGALRPDQQPGRGVCRRTRVVARHGAALGAPAVRRRRSGRQPAQAQRHPGAQRPAAAAAGPAHGRGAGRLAGQHARTTGRAAAQRRGVKDA